MEYHHDADSSFITQDRPIGSTLSAEMAQVTSVTVGAWFTGMSESIATVNREFQNSACEVGLAGTEEALLKKSKGVNKKQLEEAKIDEEQAEDEKRNKWRFRRA